MEKEFVPFNESKKLKMLGFKEPCISHYEGESFSNKLTLSDDLNDEYITPAPLYQQAIRWFRDKHNLVGSISDRGHINGKPYFLITINGNIDYMATSYPTYEEAQLECIRKLIETLFNKK